MQSSVQLLDTPGGLAAGFRSKAAHEDLPICWDWDKFSFQGSLCSSCDYPVHVLLNHPIQAHISIPSLSKLQSCLPISISTGQMKLMGSYVPKVWLFTQQPDRTPNLDITFTVPGTDALRPFHSIICIPKLHELYSLSSFQRHCC